MAFVQQHMSAIRARMRLVVEVGRRSGASVTLKDLACVVDFHDGASDGRFTMTTIDKIYTRAYLPKFCYDHTRGNAVMEENVSSMVSQLQMTHATMQPHMLLVIVRDLAG